MTAIKTYAPAIVSGLIALAAYLVGVIPAEGGFSDVNTTQWLGAIVALGAAFGFTAATPKGNELARLDSDGVVRAGPAAVTTTGQSLGAGTTVEELVPDTADAG